MQNLEIFLSLHLLILFFLCYIKLSRFNIDVLYKDINVSSIILFFLIYFICKKIIWNELDGKHYYIY